MTDGPSLERRAVLRRTAEVTKEDLLLLKELIEAGKVTPVIDRTYPLNENAEAMATSRLDKPAARS